jgi:1-deoxy-D-xylulose-5-phosphate reductoisomerase
VAVAAFLAGELPFRGIVALIRDTLEEHQAVRVDSLDDAMAWDAWGRTRARELQQRFRVSSGS